MAADRRETSLHEDFTREEEVQGSSDRSFGVVFAVVFAIIGLFPVLSSASPRLWSLGVSLVFAALAFLAPKVLAPLNALWLKFGLLLHRVVSPIVLGLLFFLTITPMAILLRLLGKDLLHLRRDPDAKSYWIERRPPGPPPESMSNQF